MHFLQKSMEKSKHYDIDEFGIVNYNYWVLAIASFTLFAVLNISLGYITYIAESDVSSSPVQNFPDAIWLMMMSSTTIGFGDVYPVTLIGRIAVFVMFILGVGILGGVGAVFANKIFGFADTNVKNRELRKQNEEILQQNAEIYEKLLKLETTLETFNTKSSKK